jgi:hypothetical protein
MRLKSKVVAAAVLLLYGAATDAIFAGVKVITPPLTNARSPELLYVSDGWQSINVLDAAKPSDQPLTVIADTNGPGALAVDDNQWLYVVNIFDSTVSIYKRGQAKPFRTLTKGLDMPTAVAVGTDGTVYVVENSGYLVTYLKGTTTPSSSTYYGIPFVGVAIDAANDIYATEGQNTSYGGVQIHPGSSQINVLFGTEFGEAYAVGLSQDLAGNFVVPGMIKANQNDGKVFMYSPVGGDPLNIQPIMLPAMGQAAFNRTGQVLYVSEGLGFPEPIDIYRYEYHTQHFRRLDYLKLAITSAVGLALSPRMPLATPKQPSH